MAGTPSYMAPEQARGWHDRIDERTDVYGLGSILYQILTGRPPASGSSVAEILKSVAAGSILQPRALDPKVPRALEAICLKAIAVEPSGRYLAAQELAEDVARWAAGEAVSVYREPWWERSRRWARRHRTLVVSGAAAALVASLALAATVASEQARAVGLADSLLTADMARVPALVDQLPRGWFRAEGRLDSAYRTAPPESDVAVRAALGLLEARPALAGYLRSRLLVAEPTALAVIREALSRTPTAGESANDLRALLEQSAGDPERRFRAACGLASSAPRDPLWQSQARWILMQLLERNRRDPVGVGAWAELLRPVGPALVPELRQIYRETRDAGDDAGRGLCARLLAVHATDPVDLAAMLEVAHDADFPSFLEMVRRRGPEVAAVLIRWVAERSPGRVTSDDEASQVAGTCVALAQLGHADVAWSHLGVGADPAVRAWLTHRPARLGLDAGLLAGRLDVETDPGIRRSLLLALGQYDLAKWPAGDRRAVADRIGPRLRDETDPGVRSAGSWLLRRWGLDAAIATPEPTRDGRPSGDRKWFLAPNGTMFTAIDAPVTFAMGSPDDEGDHQAEEALRNVEIPRSFAMATTEVTVRQFLAFLGDKPELLNGAPTHAKTASPEPDCPINALSWYMAAAYCRWLSEREGVPEDQMCYPAIETIVQAQNEGRILLGDATRTGYRMPTEAEWEYACRAGTATARPVGNGDRLLDQVAWTPTSAQNRTYPVGQLEPNDLGLFDMLGNVRERCDAFVSTDPTGQFDDSSVCVTRGGSYFDPNHLLRSARRTTNRADERQTTCGLRLVRTLPTPSSQPR